MGGNVETIKERLDIAEVISGYTKVEKAGASYKARCPFHNEKTPSFYISPLRQTYYCFGCGAKGDVFTFVEEMDGVDFKTALKTLAERAGVELEYSSKEAKSEKGKLHEVLTTATEFFQKSLMENDEAKKYLASRGVNGESLKQWRIGYAPAEWRALWSHLQALGYEKEQILGAGLAKRVDGGSGKEPYDTFRDRVIFPLSDAGGRIIAFSGRASGDGMPKYLNSPEGVLFKKSEVLYGLDKAKGEIRKKDYAVLVEGQMDLVLSHQAGVINTVAASGTAFTQAHLERLKRLSTRIILAFDGDAAGEKAAEKSTLLALSLGMEVKIADLPKGSDPADLAAKDSELWKDALRRAMPAPEYFLAKILDGEKDKRKAGRLILKRILPMVSLVSSSIERSHFISVIAKRAGIKEDALWDDLRLIKMPSVVSKSALSDDSETPDPKVVEKKSHRERIEERLAEIGAWKKELSKESAELDKLLVEEEELGANLRHEKLRGELSDLVSELAQAEGLKDDKLVGRLTEKVSLLHKEIRALEVERKKV